MGMPMVALLIDLDRPLLLALLLPSNPSLATHARCIFTMVGFFFAFAPPFTIYTLVSLLCFPVVFILQGVMVCNSPSSIYIGESYCFHCFPPLLG
jgi:hypothetical protein